MPLPGSLLPEGNAMPLPGALLPEGNAMSLPRALLALPGALPPGAFSMELGVV